MVIYKIENIKNGKVYIGQTIEFKERIYNHFNRVRSNISINPLSLKYAIINESSDNFRVDIIYKAKNLDELNKMEIYYIDLYDSTKKDSGYNLTKGGKGIYEYSDEIRDYLSTKSLDSKPICQYDKLGNLINEFHSANYASRKLNIDSRKIFRVLSGVRKSTNGYVFKYKNDRFEYNNVNKTKIYVYAISGEPVGEFESIKDASNRLNLKYSGIKKALHTSTDEKFRTNKGYYFSYIELLNPPTIKKYR